MEKDLRKFFSKYTSMSNIKTDQLPKCEQDIEKVLELIDSGEFSRVEFDLDDYRRGLAYFFGIGDVRDDEAGLTYLKAAADAEHEGLRNADAMNMYGFSCYHTSINSKELPQKQAWYEKQAFKYFAEAAKLGQTEAVFNLGVCYMEGKCTEENTELGLQFVEEAVEKGHPRAALYLEEYKAKAGLGPQVERAAPKEEVFEKILTEMRREADGGPIYVTGLFNDIFLEQGYQWVKNAGLGWICSKDNGKSYLISESELGEIEEMLR